MGIRHSSAMADSQPEPNRGRAFSDCPILGAKVDLNEVSQGSFAYLLLRDHIDAGGDSARGSINYLVIQPGINVSLPGYSFITITPEIRVNWENDNRWFVPFAIMFGKMLNKTTVASIEYKTPIQDDKYKIYDHEVEARIGFFF